MTARLTVPLSAVPASPPALTTGRVARVCGVAPRTVSKWFDSGRLKGYRIPGSLDRRVPVSNLVAFMRASGMEVPPEFDRPPGLVVVYGLCEVRPSADCVVATGQFDLGLLVGTMPIATAILGDDDGSTAAIAAAVLIRSRNPEARIVFALSADVPASVLTAAGFGRCPCSVRPVARETLAAMLATTDEKEAQSE